MDDRRIEELLQQSWQPAPTDGMLARTLARAQEEMAQRQRRPAISRWKLAFAAVGVAVMIGTNVSDRATQTRIAAMTGGGQGISAPMPNNADILRMRRELKGLLAFAGHSDKAGQHEGDESL